MRKRISVAFFRTAKGREPVREWLKSLSKAERQILGEAVKTVEFGWPIGMPLVKPISGTQRMWEIRENLPNGRIARILFTVEDNWMVLLHAFIKKSRRTPKKELEIAVKRLGEL